MAAYTTAAVDGSGTYVFPDKSHPSGVYTLLSWHGSSYPGPEALYDYELFAVINHEGQIDNGHYTNFARFQDTVRPPSSLSPPSHRLTSDTHTPSGAASTTTR
jgi:hypothetical protein